MSLETEAVRFVREVLGKEEEGIDDKITHVAHLLDYFEIFSVSDMKNFCQNEPEKLRKVFKKFGERSVKVLLGEDVWELGDKDHCTSIQEEETEEVCEEENVLVPRRRRLRQQPKVNYEEIEENEEEIECTTDYNSEEDEKMQFLRPEKVYDTISKNVLSFFLTHSAESKWHSSLRVKKWVESPNVMNRSVSWGCCSRTINPHPELFIIHKRGGRGKYRHLYKLRSDLSGKVSPKVLKSLRKLLSKLSYPNRYPKAGMKIEKRIASFLRQISKDQRFTSKEVFEWIKNNFDCADNASERYVSNYMTFFRRRGIIQVVEKVREGRRLFYRYRLVDTEETTELLERISKGKFFSLRAQWSAAQRRKQKKEKRKRKDSQQDAEKEAEKDEYRRKKRRKKPKNEITVVHQDFSRDFMLE